jgi:hypothetical protein
MFNRMIALMPMKHMVLMKVKNFFMPTRLYSILMQAHRRLPHACDPTPAWGAIILAGVFSRY